MSISSGVRATLLNDSTVKALVLTRVYPRLLPPKITLPAIAYQQISSIHEQKLSGPADFAVTRFQITCIAKTYEEVVELATAVRLALDGYSGTWDDMTVEACTIESEYEIPVFEPENSTTRQYGRGLDFMITFKETTRSTMLVPTISSYTSGTKTIAGTNYIATQGDGIVETSNDQKTWNSKAVTTWGNTAIIMTSGITERYIRVMSNSKLYSAIFDTEA